MNHARTVAEGDVVAVHYTGTLEDGTLFDSSQGRDPISFEVGSGQVIPGFDAAVRGLAVGQSRTIRIEADDAYGHRDDSLVVAVPAQQAPGGLEVGDVVAVGETRAVVLSVSDESVVIDANHPLAGQPLLFDVELVEIA
jgi:FKBP-type peptidyl-prolyl cis-trans isomerase 2